MSVNVKKHFLNYVIQKSYFLIFVIMLLAALIPCVLAEISVGFVNISNTTCLNFSAAPVNQTANCEIFFHSGGSPNPNFFNTSQGVYVMGIGAMMNISSIVSVPLYGVGGYTGSFPYYQEQDGIAFYISSSNTYGIIVLDQSKNPLGGANINPLAVNVSYKYNNQSGNASMGGVDSSPCASMNQQQCIGDLQFNCWWDFGTNLCKQDMMGGNKMNGPFADCFMFSTNISKCGMINVCVNDSMSCQNNATIFDFAKGIQCANITNGALCNNIKMLMPLCSWNSERCEANYSKQSSQPPVFMCNEALGNETLCYQLISDWNMPCSFNASGTSLCEMNSSMMCNGPSCGFKDMKTESNCQAIGGTWRSETYTYSDSYGQTKTQTDTWCEMGFSKETCSNACYACEKDVSLANGNNSGQAKEHCENSALGFCTFHNDSHAMNGLGWCDMKQEMFFGAGKCDVNCFDCNFMNNPSLECNNSQAGCKWFVDPADPTNKWCDSAKVRDCSTDCFTCYDNNSCSMSIAKPDKNTQGGCSWDAAQSICKFKYAPTKEICFNGLDDDSDNNIDCKDTDCMYDSFCGGDNLISGTQFVDCWTFGSSQTFCEQNNASCIFLDFDGEGGMPGFCERRGEHCFFAYSDHFSITGINETRCSGDASCKVNAAGKCEINNTMAMICNNNLDAANCSTGARAGICQWYNNSFGPGYCDFIIFDCNNNQSRMTGQSACEASGFCIWHQDPFGNSGFCSPLCMNNSANTQELCEGLDDSVLAGACKYNTKSCEPKALMGSDCPSKNQGNCTESNQTCMWISGANQCVDKLMMEQFAGMEGGNPAMLGTDTVSGSGYTDIVGLGVKDSQKSLVFGLQLSSVSQSSICDATKNNASYFLYLDTNGKPNDNCNASTDSEIQAGFEFYFKMQGQGSAIIQVSYKCMNGEWVPAPITFKYKNDVMCNDIRGPMFGIDKQDLQKNLKLYNATVNLRVIGASANSSDNITHPTDSIGPFYYTPGAADFKMEDCNAPGQDLDGDGFDSENDPDCQKFKKNGYIPMEVGPQCADGIDNDGNGLTDCQDDSCKFDPFVCSGQYNASADKTAPSVIWHKSNVFTSRFFVDFDTNEPSNGTLLFYNNETCNGTANINRTYQFLPPDATGNDIYFPWHHIEVENLNQNITYYYKVKVVDPAGNPATSACMNVTTATAITNITVGFDFMPPLDYYNSECLGTLYFSFDWGSDGVWDVINSTMAYAIKVNETQGKNSTIKFTSPNATQFWSISLIGVDISEAISSALSNLSTIFYTNCTLTDPFIGMNSDKFNGILQSLRPKYILLTIPDNGNTLQHCDENNLSSCSDVTGNVTKTDSSTDSSTWKVPVKTGLGFSVYTVVASGMNYTLNFSNISSTNLQLDTITNNSILINVSDTNNENMTYNFSLRVSGSALNYTINGSYPTLDMVNFSTQKNFSLNITFWSTTPGVRNVSLIATLYNDSTVVLNSSDDISYITVNITDATNPGVAITTPSSGWYASNFIVNATVTDNGALSTVQYRWENSSQNGSWVSMSNPTGNFWNATFDITSVSGGNYTLRINATDVSGNKNYSVTVTKIAVDDTIPALTNPSPAHNGFVASLTAQVFSVTATETGIILNATVFHRRSGTSVWNSNTLTCYGASPYICNVSVDISAKYLDNFTLDVYYEVYDNALNKGNNGTSGSPLTYTVDVSTPKYTYNGTNATVSTKTGENVLFNATLTDGKQLDAYIFSTNDSNYWVNSSAVDISGTSYPANATEVINSARGKYVCGKFFFNDTAGNINNTDNVCFTVANTAPVISPAISAQTRNSDESWSYDANATDADNETLTWYINDSKLSINSSTGVINDTPSEAESGVYTVLVSVDDGYVNTTGSFTYTIVDNVAPKFSYNGTNATANTKTSESVLFNATITDGNELGYYIFSTNDSGSWVNNTAIGISGTTYPANATEVINATRGMYVCGKFFFNDTAGNINSTSNVCFTVNNTAPVISPAISNQTKNSDESWSYDANATDADSDTLTWYINDSKLSINSSTGVISDTPSEDESGVYTILVSVDDSSINTTDSFTYTIVDNVAPKFSYNGTNATANTKTSETVLFNATITDGKQLDYYIFSTNDSGNWVNSSAVDISGTTYPANATEVINATRGMYVCGKFFFNDTAGNINNTYNVCFTVANTEPVISPAISAQSKNSGESWSYDVNASDADSDTLTWYINDSKLSINSGTGVISDTPSEDESGVYTILVSVDDGYVNTTGTFTYTIVDNVAPQFSYNGSNATASTKTGESVLFNATLTDGKQLDYYIFSTNDSGSWINSTAVDISGTSYLANATEVINSVRSAYVCGKFFFNDTSDNINSTDNVCFTVANTAPVISPVIVDQTRNSGDSWSYDVNASDADSETLTWYINDSKLSINSGTGVISDTPSEDESGVYTILVSVDDGYVNTTGTFTYTIVDNVAPQFNYNGSNAAASTKTGESVLFNATITDVKQLDYYIFSTNDSGSWVNSSAVDISGTSYTATATEVIDSTRGKYVCGKFFFNDTAGNINSTDNACFTVANTAPVISPAILDQSRNSDESWSYDANASDTDSETLTWYINDSKLSINSSTGVITDTPSEAESGVYTVLVSVDDGLVNTTDSFTYTIVDNVAPKFNYNGTNATVNTKTSETVLFNATITDVKQLDYYIFSTNDSGSWVNSTAVDISGTSYPANATEVINSVRGRYVCGKFFFNDTAGNINSTDNACFTVANTAPVISPAILDQSRNSDESWSYDANASDSDSDTLTWYINDSKLSINSSTGVISDTPSEAESGVYTVLVSVDDGTINTTDTFTYTIVDNVAPKFSYNGTNATVNTKTSETVLFNATITDVGQLDYYIFSTNDSNSWVNSTPVDISGTTYPANATEVIDSTRGKYVCGKFFFNDTAGNLNSTDNVCFTVANTEPVISPAIADQSRNVDESWSYDANASDADSDTLTWYINDSKLGIDTSTGNISDTPSESESGVYTILVSVDDGSINTTDTFTYTIVDNVAPQFSYNGSNATTSTKTSESVLFNATITDGKQLNYYIFSTNDSGNWVNSSAVDISGTSYTATATEIINSTRGKYVCGKFFFNDSAGNINSTDSVCFTIANTAPFISPSISAQTRNVAETWSYDANATDADNDTLTWYINDSKLSIDTSTGNISDIPIETESGVYTVLASVDDGYINTTGTFTYTIVDNVAPQFSYNGSNATASTKTSESILFNASITDGKQLDYYIFSTNDSSSWVNSSAIDISGTSYTASASEVIDSTRGKYVCGKFFFNDTAGNINSTDNACFTVANTAPVISPAILDQSRNSDESWSYDANASDSDSDTLTWYINDSRLSINSTTGVITDTPLESEAGTYTVLVTVGDGYDNTTLTFAYTVNDVTKPSVTITTPSSGWYTTNFVVNATVTDSGSGVSTVQYRLENSSENGSWVSMSNLSGNFWNATFDITSIADGNYTIRINATDASSNSNTSVTVTNIGIDDIKPSVVSQTTVYPTGQTYARQGDSVTLNVTVTDETSSIKNVTASAGSTCSANITLTKQGSTNYWSGTCTIATNASDGTQSLVITAYDNAGNFNNTINVLVNADLTSPSSPSNVQFVADPTTSYDDDTTLNVTWSAATDGTSGVKEYKVYISANGGAYTLDGTTSNLYYSFTGADGSNYSVNVTAVDNANNENYTGSVSTTTIIVDTTLPTKPTLTSPSNNTYSNDTTPLLNWSAATESYFENYTIQVSDSSSFTAINYTYKNTVSVNNNTYQVTSAWTQDTAWYWKVKVYDAARNSNTSEYFIYHLDNTPPSSVARYAGPTNGSAQQSSSTQNIQIMVNDTNKTSATITLNYWREAKDDTNSDGDWDSAEQQTITMTNITPQGLSTIYSANIDDKSNSWQGSTVLYWATGIDAAGNSISSTTGGSGSSPLVSYTIDDTPPFVSDSSPSDTVNTSSISLNVTTNENGYCKFDTESKAFSSMTYTMGGSGTAHNYTLSGLSHGITYAFYVRCNDTLGNVMTSSEVITFTVSLGPDATPPIITNTYPNGTISSSSTSLNATTNENSYCKFDAADKSFDSMSYTMTGSETTHNYTVSSLSNGNYQYYIRCNDSSNNNMTTSAIIAFTVNLGLDTTAPVVIASGPNGTDSDGNVTLYATTDEASTCRYSTTDQAYVTMEGTDISGAVTTNHSVNKTSLGNGDYQYYIRCNDSSGNIMTSSSVISFTVNLGLDTTPPVVVNSDPSSTVTNVTPDLSVTTDENAICKYDTTDKSFDNMANTMTGVTTTHTADLGTLSDIINYQYYVRCNDSSNNKMTSSAVIEFYINTGADTTPPIVTATYPNGTISASSMSLNATTNENSYCKFDVADKSFDSMVYTLEGSGTAHNYSLSSLTDGDYQYYIRCNDTNNNNMTTSAIIAFTVSDITAPNAPTSLTAVQVGVTRQVNLSWTASTSSDTQGYNIYRALGPVSKSSALIATVGKVTKYADSVPTNGNWNYTITAFDEVPNEGTEATEANVTVTIDNTLPTITINNGTYGPYRSDPGNVIDVDFSDDSGLDYVQYKIGSDGIWTTILSGINETSFTTNWGLLWGNLREGVNILYLRAYDDAGNARVAEETVKFTVDTTNPTVVITNPTTGISSGISTTLTVITSEAATCTWKTTGNYATMSTTGTIVHEQSLTNLANGSNTVYVNCSDTAGNYPSVKTVSWTVDTAGPQMSALIFGDSDAVVNTSFSVDAVVTGGLYTLSGAQYVFNSVSNAATTITLPKDGAWDETSEEINFTALDISSLSDGAHTLYIRANNSEGTWGGWEAKGFQIDTAKPTINITSPTNGSTASTTTPTITFTVTDEVDGSNINLSSITVTDSLNGNIGFSAAACTTGDNGRIYTCSFTSSALTDTSNHTITINANDKAGNSAATSTATFEVDTTKTITASLIVTDTIGVSNNNYSDGWSFTFNISTGTGGNALRFKMSNWVLSTDATKTIAIAGNVIMNYTNASGILKTYNVLNTYNESASIHSLYDQDSSVSGTQTNITIYVKIPVGTTSGTYTTAYSAGLYNV